jgi:drug/metabolite transporter (DMT)-like permease
MSSRYVHRLVGPLVLLIATVLWGSTFPVIKLVVTDIGSFAYVWIRGLIAVLCLLPYVVFRLVKQSYNPVYRRVIIGGLLTGVAYALGLWLQGWGTGLTTASNSAFITGLNVVFVHLYVALVERRYSLRLGLELLLAVLGLYLLTMPTGGFNIGDFLVLLGAVAWAAQVILVSKYGGADPLAFTFFEILPSVLFVLPDVLYSGLPRISIRSLLGLAYLGTVCTVGAFSLQAYGQKYVLPEIAALIYLLEPVFAAVFAWAMLGEVMTLTQIIGASLMFTAMVIATREVS